MNALAAVLFGLGIAIFLSFLFSWPVYMLWNECLVDAVTWAKPMTWLQSWGVTVLCGFLFKSNTTVSK